MLSHEENELLTQVSGDVPMGGMMRRYWFPAALSDEFAGGTPVRVRLLGRAWSLSAIPTAASA